MFTGIVEEIGTIRSIERKGESLVLVIEADKVLSDVKLGDSIAVNGVCLTVTDFGKNFFHADVMPETFSATSLRTLHPGSGVNLERAMAAGGRFGGHFVTGHVDSTGTIRKKKTKDNAIYMDITYPSRYGHLLLEKGSVAVDGTSLTVFNVEEGFFTISLIPHTAEQSIIGKKSVGDSVNLEFDMIGKYLYSFYKTNNPEQDQKTVFSPEFLKENGFA